MSAAVVHHLYLLARTTMDQDQTRIIPINIEDEMRDSYMEYAMSVIIGRALPDVRDGLKPVHRRVLYAMNDQGNHFNKAYRKSARVVGDVIGKYHPHGDQAVYDTIVRLAQDFSMRHPLVDGQGNFGSVDGDAAAAMRYTEIRMTQVAHELLADLDKDTVDFQPNYDESVMEPKVLPTRVPNLLVNGSTGIAVGMACNIPPHNLTETMDAFLLYIDNPQAGVADLMSRMPGPDFPTGGFIVGTKGIYDAYTTGRGVITLRARAEVEEKKDRETIIVTELPYQVNKARLIEKIADLVRDKVVEGISDLRDESDRTGMRVVIEIKKGVSGEVVLNNLYKHTQLQTSFGIINLSVVKGQPLVLSLPQVFHHFLEHRVEVVERRTRFELKKAEARAHILEGFRIALNDLDAVIEKIKSAPTPADARQTLIADYQLSEIQAKEILEMRLQRLTGMEQQKIQDEYQEIMTRIAEFKAILADRQLVLNIIRDETISLRDKYGEERRSEIVESAKDINMEDLIAREDMVVTITHAGYVKRTQLKAYRAQKRGGKGRQGMATRDEDFVEQIFVASTHDYLLVFTDLGKIYWKKVYEIPQAGPTGRGKAIVNLLNLEKDEKIRAYLPVKAFDDDHFVVFATAKGIIKKTALSEYGNPRTAGVRAINIDKSDSLIDVALTDGKQEIFLATQKGMSLRFAEEEVRTVGRVARGVIGIRLNTDDSVVGMSILAGNEGHMLTLTEKGYGKKSDIEEYRVGSRGNKGIITIKTAERNGDVVGIVQLTGDEDIMLVTQMGKLIRLKLNKLRSIGRRTQGVRMIDLEPSEQVVAIARVAENDDDEDHTNGADSGDDSNGAPLN